MSPRLRAVIAATENDVAVSAATFWELAIKRALGRLDIDLDELRDSVAADSFEPLPVSVAHTLKLPSLPDHHRDPFDRILIAQSIIDGRRLVTSDDSIHRYRGTEGFEPLRA